MIAALIAAIICSCGIPGPSSGPYEPADRGPIVATAPPPVPILFTTDQLNGRCVGAEFLLAYYSPGWDVVRMSRIMNRESECLPWAMNSSSSASGLLQVMAGVHCGWIREEFGECSRQWLADPVNNIRAAAELWRRQGMQAWAQ